MLDFKDLAPTITRQRMVVEGYPTFVITDEHIKDYLSRLSDVTDMITLIEPVFSLGAGRVTAKKGLYRDGATNLVLSGDVLFIDENGGRMETQEALINTKTGTISNSAAKTAGVQIDSGNSRIKAEHYTVGKDGKVIFRGNVHARFNPG